MADQIQWQLSGDYFENCSCSIVCPCLVSTAAPLTSRPTEGVCNVPVVFHIESGKYGSVARRPQCCSRNPDAWTDGRRKLVGGGLYRRTCR